jgi:hypothetical protein
MGGGVGRALDAEKNNREYDALYTFSSGSQEQATV